MDNPQLTWNLINQFTDKGLSLVNEESTPTFYRTNQTPQVNNLMWIHHSAFLNLADDIKFNIFGPLVDHRFLDLQFGNNEDTSNSFPPSQHVHRYLKRGSEEEGNLILEVLSNINEWKMGSAEYRATTLLQTFHHAWIKYSSTAPPNAKFNRWWMDECSMHKNNYRANPTIINQRRFHDACKQAKKEFFGEKFHEMIKNNKPWEGTGWIKQCALPKVPQLVNTDNKHIVNLDELFFTFHSHFDKASSSAYDPSFVDQFPQKDTRSFPPFSKAELTDAINTCNNSSAPGQIGRAHV